MDLYAQIGVMLLVATAFSALTYTYTSFGEPLTAGMAEQQEVITERLKTVSGADVAKFRNAPSVSGAVVYPLLRDAKSMKLAVLVQTKNQQGLVVNYGYQLRATNYNAIKMVPYGFAGVGSGAAATGTEFEKNFVTTVREVFNGLVGGNAGIRYGANALTSFTDTTPSTNAISMMAVLQPNGQPPGAMDSSVVQRVPRLMLSDPSVTVANAQQVGRTFSSTGMFYTDHVLKTDAPVNDNLSFADAAGSMYKIDRNANFYTTLILGASGEVIGVYVEEHGVAAGGSILGTSMFYNGTISQLY